MYRLDDLIEKPFSIVRTKGGVVLSYFAENAVQPSFSKYDSVEEIVPDMFFFKKGDWPENRVLSFNTDDYALNLYANADRWMKAGCYVLVHFEDVGWDKRFANKDAQQQEAYFQHPLRTHLRQEDFQGSYVRAGGWAVWSQQYFDFYFGLGNVVIMSPEMFVPLFADENKRLIFYPQLVDKAYVWKSYPFAAYERLNAERDNGGWVRNILRVTKEDGRQVVLSYQATGVPCGQIDLYHVELHEESL